MAVQPFQYAPSVLWRDASQRFGEIYSHQGGGIFAGCAHKGVQDMLRGIPVLREQLHGPCPDVFVAVIQKIDLLRVCQAAGCLQICMGRQFQRRQGDTSRRRQLAQGRHARCISVIPVRFRRGPGGNPCFPYNLEPPFHARGPVPRNRAVIDIVLHRGKREGGLLADVQDLLRFNLQCFEGQVVHERLDVHNDDTYGFAFLRPQHRVAHPVDIAAHAPVSEDVGFKDIFAVRLRSFLREGGAQGGKEECERIYRKQYGRKSKPHHGIISGRM